jgi:uncharacterized protein (DUF2147 family)
MPITLFFVAVLLSIPLPSGKDNDSRDLVGTWRTENDKAHVEIFACDSLLCGRIVWARQQEETTDTLVDIHNPDEVLRHRPIVGLLILREFVADGANRWTGGTVYDPESGKSYSATMELVERDTLELRGYVLIPLFGRTTTWTRLKPP